MMTRQSPALGTGLPVIQGEAQTVNQHSLCGGTATHVTHSLDSYAPQVPELRRLQAVVHSLLLSVWGKQK